VSEAIFSRTEEPGRVRASELARGPWDPNAQHGGAPAALLARELERLPNPDDLALARVTYELLRPVPLSILEVGAEVVRPGRRVQLLEGSIRDEDGTVLVRARALRVASADASIPTTPSSGPPPGPENSRANDFPGEQPMFATHAMEIRFVAGAFREIGPATAWFWLRHPLLDGEEPSPYQRLAAAADFGNGISTVLPWDEYVFINPDLTVYIERAPVGEWICLEAETRLTSQGVAVAESTLYDERGRIGRAMQALLVAKR
jgi:hypothetical protein